MMLVLTCNGCGGTRLDDVRDEADLVVRRIDERRVQVRVPLPLLCLDCGGTSHSYREAAR